jgi:hypothetical protein
LEGKREKFILHKAKMLFRELKEIRNIIVRIYTGEVFAFQAVSTDILKSGKENFKKQNLSAESTKII